MATSKTEDTIVSISGGQRFVVMISFALLVASCANTQSPPTPPAANVTQGSAPVAAIAAETVLTVHGKIIAVDPASKRVTLEGPGGKDVTLTVNNPYNLQSLRAGDRYVAQFIEYASIVGKAPSDNPPVATLTAGLWSARPGQHPGAVAAQEVRLVLVIAAIDPAAQRVTLRAPDGSTENVRVTNPQALDGLQVGDRIVINLVQAVAIALVAEAKATQ